jgi:hypothetical protein
LMGRKIVEDIDDRQYPPGDLARLRIEELG